MILALLLACSGGPDATPATVAPGAHAPSAAHVSAPRPGSFNLGRAATAEEIAAWDIDVDASGRSLPAGSGTVAQGQALYAERCVACHGLQGEGGLGPKLWGANTAPDVDFSTDAKIPRTIGNWWPYATTVFDYVRRAMPQTGPGSLTDDESYALVGFLLAKNGLFPEDGTLTKDALMRVEMPAKSRFVPDDRGPGPDGFR